MSWKGTHAFHLSHGEVNYLIAILTDVEERGDYWGNRAQFWKRHQKLITYLKERDDAKSTS